MRIREIAKLLLNEVLPKLEYESVSVPNAGYKISNHDQIVKAIYILEENNLFKSSINQFKSIDNVYYSQMKTIIIDYKSSTLYVDTVTEIRSKIFGVLESVDIMQNEIDENSISVKIPESKYLSDVAKYAERIETALSQLLSVNKVKEEVKLIGFDTGSMWFDIYLGTTLATSLVGGAVWSAIVIRKKYYESEIMKKKMEGLSVNVDAIKSLKDAMDDDIKNT